MGLGPVPHRGPCRREVAVMRASALPVRQEAPPAQTVMFAHKGHFGTARAQPQSLRCLSREHPSKPPPYRSMHDPFKTASGVQNSGPWDPWQASD